MNEMRIMIRELLAEEIQNLKSTMANGANPSVYKEEVQLNSDEELNAFARRILDMANDPAKRNEIIAGRHVFSFGGRGGAYQPSPQTYIPPPVASAKVVQLAPTSAPSPVRQEFMSGLMTERDIDKLPSGTRVLTVGKSVRLTPLARDEVRRLNIKIERVSS